MYILKLKKSRTAADTGRKRLKFKVGQVIFWTGRQLYCRSRNFLHDLRNRTRYI